MLWFDLPAEWTSETLSLSLALFCAAGSKSYAFQRKAQNALGDGAQPQAKFIVLSCETLWPMMRRVFGALALPTVSYVLEVWALLTPQSLPDIKKMAFVKMAIACSLAASLPDKISVIPPGSFRHSAERTSLVEPGHQYGPGQLRTLPLFEIAVPIPNPGYSCLHGVSCVEQGSLFYDSHPPASAPLHFVQFAGTAR